MKETCKECGKDLSNQIKDIFGELCDRCFVEMNDNMEDPYLEVVREAQRLTVHND